MKRIATLAALAAALLFLSIPVWGQIFVPVPEAPTPAASATPVVVLPEPVDPAVVVPEAPARPRVVTGPTEDSADPPLGGDPGGYVTREQLEEMLRQRQAEEAAAADAAKKVASDSSAPPASGATVETKKEKKGGGGNRDVSRGTRRDHSRSRGSESATTTTGGWSLARRFAALRGDMGWLRIRIDGLVAAIASLKNAIAGLIERLGLVEWDVKSLQKYTEEDVAWAKSVESRLDALKKAEEARQTGLPAQPTAPTEEPPAVPAAPAATPLSPLPPTTPPPAAPAESPTTPITPPAQPAAAAAAAATIVVEQPTSAAPATTTPASPTAGEPTTPTSAASAATATPLTGGTTERTAVSRRDLAAAKQPDIKAVAEAAATAAADKVAAKLGPAVQAAADAACTAQEAADQAAAAAAAAQRQANYGVDVGLKANENANEIRKEAAKAAKTWSPIAWATGWAIIATFILALTALCLAVRSGRRARATP